MKRKTLWLILSSLMVVALVLSSCQAATVEEEKETQTVTGTVTETEVVEEEEEEEEAVVEEEGAEMVRDVMGRLVEKPQHGGILYVNGDNAMCYDNWRDNSCAGVLGSVYDVLMGGDWSKDRSECPFLAVYIPPSCSKGWAITSYENPDPLTYILHLREGMHFQNKPPVNGREVTADDVKWSVDRIMGLGDFAETGPTPYVGYSAWRVLEEVEVVDKYTFVFHLSQASAIFPEYWGPEIGPYIMPHELVEQYGDDFSWEYACGSGPWQLKDLVMDSSRLYVRNPTYYGVDDNFPENHIPYPDALQVLIMPDWTTTMAAYRTGKIDTLGMGWEDALSLKESNPELLWNERPNTCMVVDINNSIEPYSDIRVRRALQMAINNEELAEEYYGGTALPYPFMIHPSFPQYFTPLEELPEDCQEGFIYNPERARQLLAEAGYPNGFQQTMPLSGAWDLADLVIAYWNDIGVETDIRIMDGASYGDFIYSGNAEMVWIWSCGYWMHTQILGYWYGGQEETPWNFSNANDPIHNANWDAIMAEPDANEREKLIKEAFTYGTCQFFYTATPVQSAYISWQPWVKGYQGEERLIAVNMGPTLARMWLDLDLKEQMTGRR